VSFLDELPKEIFDALGTDMREATVYAVTQAPDGYGGWSDVTISHHTVGIVGSFDIGEQSRFGIPSTSVKIVLLQYGMSPPLDLARQGIDAQVEIDGGRYEVQRASQDPAHATWIVQGAPING
jgi:hypothetical protein